MQRYLMTPKQIARLITEDPDVFNETDTAQRRLERRGDPGDPEGLINILQGRIRSGELDPRNVAVASFLGDPSAMALFPDPDLPGETYSKNHIDIAIKNSTTDLRMPRQFLMDCFERARLGAPLDDDVSELVDEAFKIIISGKRSGVSDVHDNLQYLVQDERDAGWRRDTSEYLQARSDTSHSPDVSREVGLKSSEFVKSVLYGLQTLVGDFAFYAGLACGHMSRDGTEGVDGKWQRKRLIGYLLGDLNVQDSRALTDARLEARAKQRENNQRRLEVKDDTAGQFAERSEFDAFWADTEDPDEHVGVS